MSWFRPVVLLPPAGAEGAAAGATGRPAGLHPRHGGVQEGVLLILQWADLPAGVDRWAAAHPQLPSSSGPAPPQTAGMLCGETPSNPPSFSHVLSFPYSPHLFCSFCACVLVASLYSHCQLLLPCCPHSPTVISNPFSSLLRA